MERIIENLEEYLTTSRTSGAMGLNEFQDSDFAMYPAIEINEQQLSADECETIANNILAHISTGSNIRRGEPARALAALAYNSLMDPTIVRTYPNYSNQRPFFHKPEFKFSEDWLRISGKSELDLRDYLNPPERVAQSEAKLKLILPGASELARKATIGAWAFYYLRFMGNLGAVPVVTPSINNLTKTITTMYGFQVPYKLRLGDKLVSARLSHEYLHEKPGEVLYLYYRSIITLENMTKHHGAQRELLQRLAFSHGALCEAGLWMWTWSRDAAEVLCISEEEFFDLLEEALDDPSWARYTSWSKKNLNSLREFHQKYIVAARRGTLQCKYFQYAKPVNHLYFHSLSLRGNRELVQAMMHVIELKQGIEIDIVQQAELWTVWGKMIGAKVYEKYSSRQREMGACGWRGATAMPPWRTAQWYNPIKSSSTATSQREFPSSSGFSRFVPIRPGSRW